MEFNADKYKIFDTILKNEDYQNEEIIEVIGKALSVCSPFTWEKINQILLNIIMNNEEELKKECYQGLPDYLPSLRAIIWKINFRYLPHDIKKWKNVLESKRKEYFEIKNAFNLRKKEEIKIFEELEEEDKYIEKGEEKKEEEKEEENIEKNENGNNNIENLENNNNDINTKNNIHKERKKSLSSLAECTDRNLLEMINKDINRTRITMNFFNSLSNNKNKMTDEDQFKMFSQKNNCTYQNYKQVYIKGRDKEKLFENETNSDVIERIIYIYSKLNKEVGYVQGMNELIAPIYYCFSIDKTVSLENVEADTFWCFTLLMKDIKKLFLKENDNLKGGILDRVFILDLIISNLQKDIYRILSKNNVNIFHFAFSWINVFFCQEFFMPDILRLWDIIFCEKNRFCFVYFFAMAILEIKKKKIANKDFCNIIGEIKDLQNENIEKIIDLGIYFKNKYEKKVNIIISESEKNGRDNKEMVSKCQNSISKGN